jgi:hypothetical protein
MTVSGQTYRPRFERLERLFDSIVHDHLGGGMTLHGCRIGPARGPGRSDILVIAAEKPRSSAKKGGTRS